MERCACFLVSRTKDDFMWFVNCVYVCMHASVFWVVLLGCFWFLRLPMPNGNFDPDNKWNKLSCLQLTITNSWTVFVGRENAYSNISISQLMWIVCTDQLSCLAMRQPLRGKTSLWDFHEIINNKDYWYIPILNFKFVISPQQGVTGKRKEKNTYKIH